MSFNLDFYFASQSDFQFFFLCNAVIVLKTILLANKSQSGEIFSYACSMAKTAWPLTVQLYNVTYVTCSLYKM